MPSLWSRYRSQPLGVLWTASMRSSLSLPGLVAAIDFARQTLPTLKCQLSTHGIPFRSTTSLWIHVLAAAEASNLLHRGALPRPPPGQSLALDFLVRARRSAATTDCRRCSSSGRCHTSERDGSSGHPAPR